MRKALVVAVMALAGCAPLNGAPCDKPGARQCDGPDVAYCEGAEWKTYACPSVCDATKGACDWRGVKAGTPCPAMDVDANICTADGEIALCHLSATWVVTPCAACRKDKKLSDLVQPMNGAYSCN